MNAETLPPTWKQPQPTPVGPEAKLEAYAETVMESIFVLRTLMTCSDARIAMQAAQSILRFEMHRMKPNTKPLIGSVVNKLPRPEDVIDREFEETMTAPDPHFGPLVPPQQMDSIRALQMKLQEKEDVLGFGNHITLEEATFRYNQAKQRALRVIQTAEKPKPGYLDRPPHTGN
jgi:hypothetical protein